MNMLFLKMLLAAIFWSFIHIKSIDKWIKILSLMIVLGLGLLMLYPIALELVPYWNPQ